jgi:hypothetical protein
MARTPCFPYINLRLGVISLMVLAMRFPQNNVMDLGKCFMKSIIVLKPLPANDL